MWFYLVALAVVAAGIVGTFATGGIFTIVLIPIGVIALVAAIAFRGMGAFAQSRGGRTAAAGTESALPHSSPSEPGHVRASPEALADARRAQQ